MNIHKSQLFWCEQKGYYWFWHTAIYNHHLIWLYIYIYIYDITSEYQWITYIYIYIYIWLVIWNMAGLFSPIVGMMIQSDELIFFRGVGIPPISYVFFSGQSLGWWWNIPSGHQLHGWSENPGSKFRNGMNWRYLWSIPQVPPTLQMKGIPS